RERVLTRVTSLQLCPLVGSQVDWILDKIDSQNWRWVILRCCAINRAYGQSQWLVSVRGYTTGAPQHAARVPIVVESSFRRLTSGVAFVVATILFYSFLTQYEGVLTLMEAVPEKVSEGVSMG
ncbi:unnamed protein product, partial [Laminaria digitata]